LVNNSFRLGSINETYQAVPYGWAKINLTSQDAGNTGSVRSFTYNYTINAGEQDFILNVLVGNTSSILQNMTVGTATTGGSPAATLSFSFQNKSVWNSAGADLAAELFRLGTTASSAEASDINVTTEASAPLGAGAKTQEEIVDDSGVIVLTPATYTASDKVVFKVPSKALAVKAYFGKSGAAATTGETTTTHTVIPVTTDVVKLDTEVMDAAALNNNVVLVGGPCVNTLVANLAASGKFPYTCDTWPAENAAWVSVIQDAFQTGKVAVVVAGTRAQDTDLAALAIQSGMLSGKNATSVKLTGADINSLVIV
ncbi:MAG: S-layer protein, partial [Nanoarchaeota archaeon]|nr:S-layer protein [Nanoarchaeota archaeon]